MQVKSTDLWVTSLVSRELKYEEKPDLKNLDSRDTETQQPLFESSYLNKM